MKIKKDPLLNVYFLDKAQKKRIRRAAKPNASAYAKQNVR